MDSFEAIKVVRDRIQQLEPEHVAKKVIGYIYLQGYPDQEIIRLALGPDSLIHNVIQNAKAALMLASTPNLSPPISPSMNPAPILDPSLPFGPFSPASPRPIGPRAALQVASSSWDPQHASENLVHSPDFMPWPYFDSVSDDYGFQNQFISLEEQLEPINSGPLGFANDYYFRDSAFGGLRGIQDSPSAIEIPVKTCHYFNKGFCKHGNSCRYFHGQSFPDSYHHLFGSHSSDSTEDHTLPPGSLEKLEYEITELLKSRRGNPVSIASLPMMYYEMYGRTLQAEGYLTESQRHGKAGYSLTKLLARLRNSIRLIDRPHGQHAVILAEDAPKYMEFRGERNDPGPIVTGSRQIYLTFPAESTFTEEDVSNYFNTFGQVQDVRIPCQQKRMFGFVTFASADTVKIILSKGNPHYVCGARVLVKPYREKSKLMERKFHEKLEPSIYFNSQYVDLDPELQARWETRLLKKQLVEEHEQALELETRRLSQLQLARKPVASQSFFGYSIDDLKVSEGHNKFSSAERFNYLLDVLNNGSTSDGNSKLSGTSCGDQEGNQGLNLPDSPFASAVANSISAVI